MVAFRLGRSDDRCNRRFSAGTAKVLLVLIVCALCLVVASCSSAGVVDAGRNGSGDSDGPQILAARLEASKAMIHNPGEGWTEVDRWYAEGAEPHWNTGCPGFDRLGDIFIRDTVETVVWERGSDRLFQRTHQIDWDAAQFVAAVEQVPVVCPLVEVGATTVRAKHRHYSLSGRSDRTTRPSWPHSDNWV